MIIIKSESELKGIAESGKILAEILEILRNKVKPGISTKEIDSLAEDLINKKGALPAFKGFKGFPACVCTSVNEEVVHGLPGERILKDGDLLKIDLGINYKNYFSDCAISLAVGKVGVERKKLIEVTKKALLLGIKQAKSGNHLSDISSAIQSYVESKGFSVVRQFVGHGIGRSIHEDPEIPNFGQPHKGPILKSGMVFAIEPMVNTGTWEVEILQDGWTAVTKDRTASAHFEHTVAVTDNGPKVLTEKNS